MKRRKQGAKKNRELCETLNKARTTRPLRAFSHLTPRLLKITNPACHANSQL